MTNIHDVIKAFIDGDGDKIKTKNVFIDDALYIRTLYSYGRHFPMCIITDDKKVLLNISKYSSSTSKQQGQLKTRIIVNFNSNDIIELSTEQLKKFLDLGCITYAEYTATKI